MKNYDKIEDWEAEKGDVPSVVENPVFDDADLYPELLDYIPSQKCKVLSRLDEKSQYIFQEPNGDWNEPIARIMNHLKMTLKEDDNGKHYIEDDDVKYDWDRIRIDVEPGWKITKWRLDFDENSGEVSFLDTVTWERNTPDDPVSTKSFHKWVPYIKN